MGMSRRRACEVCRTQPRALPAKSMQPDLVIAITIEPAGGSGEIRL
jgi:hypothetical protein